MINEADTCRKYVLPKLIAAGWDNDPRSFTEQKTFTDGRIVLIGEKVRRRPQKRADYLLRYTRDFVIAVVEAKAAYKSPSDGLQQAKDYARVLGLKFAYATNGHGIVEFDFLSGKERELESFPTPDELWQRLRTGEKLKDDTAAERLLTPYNHLSGKSPRYYQDIAINRTVQSILQGKRRILLTMATGTGKTVVAFQICWKLWQARWNRTGEYRRPKILYLADRNILIDDPKDKIFTPFGDARWKIENGQVNKGRELYFAIYQAIAKDENRPGLYREYAPDFFDLIVIDECHRGSAAADSAWRQILEYFEPATQIGLTATPRQLTGIDWDESPEDRQITAGNIRYFGEPVYEYDMAQGMDDGYQAACEVIRRDIFLDHKSQPEEQTGVRQPDLKQKQITNALTGEHVDYRKLAKRYDAGAFERHLQMPDRVESICKDLFNLLLRTGGPEQKTIIFCASDSHADKVASEMGNLYAAWCRENEQRPLPNYAFKCTSASSGNDQLPDLRGSLRSYFIAATVDLLTTGVDVPVVENIVFFKYVRSPIAFYQMVGRGTRLNPPTGKLMFRVYDYTNASRLFGQDGVNGQPIRVLQVKRVEAATS